MIKGKLKEELNEFELEIQMLLGSHHERTGYIYYFELLHETFTRAVKHLISDSQQFKKDLLSEDKENSQSLIQSNESVSNPLIQTLYNSYFITVHSELEIMLTKVNEIVKRIYDSSFPKKTIEMLDVVNNKKQKITEPFIKDTIKRYTILISYNFVRNGIIHPVNDKNKPGFEELEKCIDEGKIINLDIIDYEFKEFDDEENIIIAEIGFNYLITEIDFIVKYTEEIISFFQDLISNSKKYRKRIS
ncbi:hypothetical protein [Flavobacterium aciduliphilum]|uniref:Uncharacterized protein n=1 Tax=Flavobacterium aciduliphilum TaxID=1101402 RepID=A0A328YN43_9FLAO|nr:hypothetical protein [Flavobacterium aciduliphilum]RAR71496.1 hypothetical protein CLV55_10752 [Flavobacterium aciduliphilum]